MDTQIYEAEAARALGIGRDELRTLRHRLLEEPGDYQRVDNRVVLTPQGVGKIEAHLMAPGGVQTGGHEKLAPVVTLHVWRTFAHNRHILEAHLPEKNGADWQNRLRVKVKDARLFTRITNTGEIMAIACRLVQGDYYEHVGPLPRRKGRQ